MQEMNKRQDFRMTPMVGSVSFFEIGKIGRMGELKPRVQFLMCYIYLVLSLHLSV